MVEREIVTATDRQVVAVVATKNRKNILVDAISSIEAQSLRPDLVIIVGERDSDFGDLFDFPGLRILLITNKRTSNLSGAINTAIQTILELGFQPDITYLAMLDDDDRWDPNYLQKCVAASGNGEDWVVSGIKRYEGPSAEGIDLTIPVKLSTSAFLTGNPHVQGSNLFIKLSALLRAGGFDENLESTTDRDVGIRLCNLNTIRIVFIQEHLVHHNAYGEDRLSKPKSQVKTNGLVQFYRKYSPIMSAEERNKFLNRAYSLFKCDPTDFQSSVGVQNS